MALIISQKILDKLASKHNVKQEEVAQCFANRHGEFLLDAREDHASDPPTLWFISETDYGRKLKVGFIKKGKDIYLRSAFSPNEKEIRIYHKHGKSAK